MRSFFVVTFQVTLGWVSSYGSKFAVADKDSCESR